MGGRVLSELYMRRLTVLFFALFLMCSFSAIAAMPYETPYYAVGSDFIASEGGCSYPGTSNCPSAAFPKINVLYDNTNIYLDNNNDGVWDYRFSGNASNYISLNPIIESARLGAKIRTDKPVAYYQPGYTSYYNNWGDTTSFSYVFPIPPINSWRKEYILIPSGASSWNLLVDKTANIFMDDGIAITNLSVAKMDRKSINPGIARVYSDESFLPVSQSTPAAIPGRNFYAPYGTLKLAVIEDGTEVDLDWNNDGFFDNHSNYNKGTYSIFTIEGAHIRSSKKMAVYADVDTVFFAVLPSTAIGNDFFATGPYAIPIFTSETGFSDSTSFDLYSQKTGNFNRTVSSTYGNKLNYPNIGSYYHIVSDMPVILASASRTRIYGGLSTSAVNVRSISLQPYSQIYLTTYSKEKYVSNDQINQFIVRIFNPFVLDTAENFSVFVNYPENFTDFSGIEIDKRSLFDDSLIESAYGSYTTTTNGFQLNSGMNPILSSLSGQQYFEIRYELMTPDYLGQFEFPQARMTYDADTWIIS